MNQTRRNFLKHAFLSLGTLPVLANATGSLFAATNDAPTPAERNAMRKTALAVMNAHSIPGLSMSIARHGNIVYEEALGFADSQGKITPSNLFRIASVSKPITSVAVFTLTERGRISLEDFVFGQRACGDSKKIV